MIYQNLGYNEVSQSMIDKMHTKIHGKLGGIYKGIVAGSVAIPLLFGAIDAKGCDLECNVKKDTPTHETQEIINNPLNIPIPIKEKFKYRHTTIEPVRGGSAVFVYDGYSMNDPKGEKIDLMVKSQVIANLSKESAEGQKSEDSVQLKPFQYVWVDEKGKTKVAVDYDGKIDGDEIDITDQYMASLQMYAEQREKQALIEEFLEKQRKKEVAIKGSFEI